MKYLNRRQATAHLRELGIPIGGNTLAQLAVLGTGPLYRYSGRHTLYLERDLDRWAETRLSPPVRSPAERAGEPLSPPKRKARGRPRRVVPAPVDARA